MATSTTATTSSTTSVPGFSGTSTYASDFQNAITRDVQIASLPITQLQSDQTALTAQSTELGTLDSKFTSLQSAVQAVDTAVSGSSFNTDVSDPNSLSANVSDGATEGNYSVQIDSIGAYASSLTSSTWVDTAGSPQTYQLVVGGNSYNITPTDNSAASVVSAINSQEGNVVQATMVNVGSSSSPDYRIALQNQSLGDSPVDLQLNGTSLQTQQTQGALAEYEVNGSGLTVSSSSRTATISPGLTVDLLAQTSTPVNITVTRSSTALANALSGFVTAYNSAVDEVDAQRGQDAGPLQGQGIVFDLSQALGTIGTYTGDGSFGGLASLGLTLGSDGHFTFDESTLLGADLTNSSAVNSFLGSIEGDGGFLGSVNDTLNGLEDTNTGAIKTTEAAYETESTQMQNQITSGQAQVALLQTNLTNQMSAADSLIASMQSQYSYLTSVFQAEQTASQEIANE
jgi:flagellar hook-associated protein 2